MEDLIGVCAMRETQAVAERPTIDVFMRLFLSALVVRGKSVIYIRFARGEEERVGMRALYEYLNGLCEREKTSEDRDYLYFLLRLRGTLAPGNIGSFDGFRGQLLGMMTSMISVELPYCNFYRIAVQPTTARCYLEQADRPMCELAEAAAEAYLRSQK
jgi:hypothetical protein